jgi:preprotein translocase subunit SecA
MDRLGMEEGQPIEHQLISRAIENAQKKVEAHHFDIRKHLLEYDDVMNKHREIIYSLRKDVLTGEGTRELIDNMTEEMVDSIISRYIDPKDHPEDWNIQALKEDLARIFGLNARIGPEDLGEDEFHQLRLEGLTELVEEQVKTAYEAKWKAFDREELESIEKYFLLQIIDKAWIDHLQDMDSMKEGIGLRGYGQLDPLREYQKEGYSLFEELMARIREEALLTLSRIQILKNRPEEMPKKRDRKMNLSHGDQPEKGVTVKREGQKIGRNDPCPCGSGKKYKKCCGANK